MCVLDRRGPQYVLVARAVSGSSGYSWGWFLAFHDQGRLHPPNIPTIARNNLYIQSKPQIDKKHGHVEIARNISSVTSWKSFWVCLKIGHPISPFHRMVGHHFPQKK